MSLPTGARWIYNARGNKSGVRLADGRQVSRGEGERLGARESGYRSPTAERRATAQRREQLSTGRTGERLKSAINKARATAKSEGRRFDRRAVETAYWRAQQAGRNFRDAPASERQQAQRELQRAMSDLSHLTTGREAEPWTKGHDTP